MISPAPKILLLGETGTGKTHSIRTLIDAGITPCVIAHEFPDILQDIPKDKIHWRFIPPGVVGWDTALNMAKNITLYSNDAMQKLPGVDKAKYTQYYEVLGALANFKCDRCGAVLGDAATWGPDRAVVIDGLSGLSIIAKQLAVGAKMVMSQPDWGTAMGAVEYIHQLCTDKLNCWYILIAHTEPERDEVAGTIKLMASTLGRKLAPKLPRNMTDIVLARREGSSFFWSTSTANVDLKTRNLPFSDKLPPDFGTIAKAWQSRIAKGNAE